MSDLFLDALWSALGLGAGDPAPATLTVDQAAEVMRISRGLAYAGVRDGSIPSIRVGRRLLVPTASLRALLAGPMEQGQPGSGRAEASSGFPCGRREPDLTHARNYRCEPTRPGGDDVAAR